MWAAWALQPGEHLDIDCYEGLGDLGTRIRKDKDGFSLMMKMFLSKRIDLTKLTPSGSFTGFSVSLGGMSAKCEWVYRWEELHTRYLAVITPRSLLDQQTMVPAFNPIGGVIELCELDGKMVDDELSSLSQVSSSSFPANGAGLANHSAGYVGSHVNGSNFSCIQGCQRRQSVRLRPPRWFLLDSRDM